jgi:hypothetical protein
MLYVTSLYIPHSSRHDSFVSLIFVHTGVKHILYEAQTVLQQISLMAQCGTKTRKADIKLSLSLNMQLHHEDIWEGGGTAP